MLVSALRGNVDAIRQEAKTWSVEGLRYFLPLPGPRSHSEAVHRLAVSGAILPGGAPLMVPTHPDTEQLVAELEGLAADGHAVCVWHGTGGLPDSGSQPWVCRIFLCSAVIRICLCFRCKQSHSYRL